MVNPKTASKKKTEEEQAQENEAYMENYREMVKKLYVLGRIYSQQFLGNRPDGDPRVEYLAALESFKNLVNAQIAGIVRIMTMLLGKKKQEFFRIMEEELVGQLKVMEDDLGVIKWSEDGTPEFDLDKLREKTKGWPQ